MKVYLWTLYIIFFQTLQLILLGFAVSNINQSFWFHLESGCLLTSLPSNAVFDGTSGIGFICDLNDNIVAPWPTTSYSLPSSCNRSTYKLPTISQFLPLQHWIVLCNIFTMTISSLCTMYNSFVSSIHWIAATKLPSLPTATSSQNGKNHTTVLLQTGFSGLIFSSFQSNGSCKI